MRKTTNLQDYMRVSKYARTKVDNTKETWEEAVARVMEMHSKAKSIFDILPEQSSLVWDMYNNQEVVGAQRALQYGGEQLIKHNMRMYNCSGSLLNRTNFFNQLFYILLCGAGAGYRLHKDYIEMMPTIQQPLTGGDTIVIEDSIEGWADSILHLMEAYFYNKPLPVFDYSVIRPEGAYISGGFSAPGPDPLKRCIDKVNGILKTAIGRHLTTFECHRIACIIGDAVISGGIRRSALIAMFELDDLEMLSCKTGNWYTKYPELARANNSVVLNPDEVDYKQFEEIFNYIKQYGEPGIVFSRHKNMVVNPCCVSGETRIELADEIMSIKDMAERKEIFIVKSYNELTKSIVYQPAFAFKSGHKQCYDLQVQEGEGLLRSIRMTDDHRVYVSIDESEFTWMTLDELRFHSNSDIRILTSHISKVAEKHAKVVNIHTVGMEDVYDISVYSTHNFFATIDAVTSSVLLHNCEVGMYPIIKDSKGEERYGWSLCNLTEIPITNIKDEAHFYKACEAAAALGTIQATYTDFPYLAEEDGFNPSEEIVKRDALIGVGLTGMYDNPSLSFNEEIQRNGAKIVKTANRVAANALGINAAARTTVIKPSGNGSQLYGTASGIHPRHAKNYIRHIQANNNEQSLKEFKKINPDSVVPSIYNPSGESVIGFAVKAPDTAVVRKDISTKEFIENVVKTQSTWIAEGTNLDHPFYKEYPEMADLTHNVSNTITVRTGEWDIAKDTIWENRDNLCGISMLSEVELDYNQMPFTEVLMPEELVKEYGDAAILSSGLVVDGLEVFDDLWTACDTAITVAQKTPRAYSKDISVSKEKVLQAVSNRLTEDLQYDCDYNGSCVKRVEDIIHIMKFKADEQNDWVRRFVKFAHRHFNDDLIQCMNCLKHVSLYHKWCKLQEATLIDWDSIKWENVLQRAGSDTAQGCSGGKCEI